MINLFNGFNSGIQIIHFSKGINYEINKYFIIIIRIVTRITNEYFVILFNKKKIIFYCLTITFRAFINIFSHPFFSHNFTTLFFLILKYSHSSPSPSQTPVHLVSILPFLLPISSLLSFLLVVFSFTDVVFFIEF